MNSKDRYLQEVSLLTRSGCGVLFSRTREPFRAVDALRDMAFTQGLPFSKWDIVNGWQTSQVSDPAGSTGKLYTPKLIDGFAALKWILDVDGGWKSPLGCGIFVLSGIHPWLAKHPGMTEALRQYVRLLSESSRRRVKVVLLVPETENLPDELAHDIPIVDFGLPSPEEMAEILEYIMDSSAPDGTESPELFDDEEKETLVASCGGMTQMEAELAYSKAIIEAKPAGGSVGDIEFAEYNASLLRSKTDVVKQSDVLELKEPVPMSDVGGLDVLKTWIKEAAQSYTQAARDFGCDVPKGIAAVGPPGTGKTLAGMAIATYFGQPLVLFDVSKCYASLVGESEKKVRIALKQLEAMGRVVVLFDEIDKTLGGAQNNNNDAGVSKKILSAILTFLSLTKAPVFPIFTANRSDTLPPELLRKGRLDEVWYVPPPNRAEREAIFKIHLRKRKQDPAKIRDLQAAIAASTGFVSSELEAAVKEAVKHAFIRKVPVTGALLAEKLGSMRPISEAFPEDFRRMCEWAKNNARCASLVEEEQLTDRSIGAAPRRRMRSIQTGE